MEKYFRLTENKTDVKTEIVAGITTFMTMAYIIFVNPALLSSEYGAKMPFEGVMAATCIASAFATLLMAILARYPVALAPGMGLNAFFSFTICGAMGVPWQVALGMVFVSGTLFTLLTFLRVREMIVDAIPQNLKLAIAVGVGVFIAFIGLKDAGIVVSDPNTFVKLGSFHEPAAALAIFGLIVTCALLVLNVRGGILIGILATGVVGILFKLVHFQGVFGYADVSTVAFKLNILGALSVAFIVPILILLFFDMFDTIGTLIGVGEQAGFLKEGKMPRMTQALASDAIGTIGGALSGTSTVTSYIESCTGVAAGGRTGLASIVTAILFIVALFFLPIAEMFGGGVVASWSPAGGAPILLYPITAPALILVGYFMTKSIVKIQWDDATEAIPAFLAIVLMPLTFSIAEGLAVAFISYPVLKLASGRGHEVSPLVYILALVFLLRYAFLQI
jgi:AGZA family xanthine/uracil permease-like MFS transporter